MFNYSTTAAITAQIGSSTTPGIEIYNNTNTTTVFRGLFPILSVNIALLLNITTILGIGQVVIVGNAKLTASDKIITRYTTGGISVAINLNVGSGASPSALSIKRIA